jgi:hypothetical protein
MGKTITVIFNICVLFLQDLAKLLGMTYQEVNVWIFCVIWPALTVLLFILVRVQRKKIKSLKAQLSKAEKRA